MDILKQSIATKVPMTELMQQAKVAETPEQQKEGLSNQPEGTSMVFPESTGSFNTMDMDYPVNIKKVDNQGSLVRSYENVPPGVGSLPMGNDVGTVIETPANYQGGGFDAWRNTLPANLKNTDTTTYNLRGAYESGLNPVDASDGTKHLQSVNPKTLEFLKSSDHKSVQEEINWFNSQSNTKPLMGTPHPSTHKIVEDPSGYFEERSLKYVKKQEGNFGNFSMPSDNTSAHNYGLDALNAEKDLTQEEWNEVNYREARKDLYESIKTSEMDLYKHGFNIPDADASHLTFEAIFPYAKGLKVFGAGAKTMFPKGVSAFTKDGVKIIPKKDAVRLNRVEDANITSKTFDKYEDSNWFSDFANEHYVNLTKRNPNIKGSTTLASDEAKRLITANVDKELAQSFNVSQSTNKAKTLSGGSNKYIDTEYVLPPDIVKSMRTAGSGPGYSTHIGDAGNIMENMQNFYRQEGGPEWEAANMPAVNVAALEANPLTPQFTGINSINNKYSTDNVIKQKRFPSLSTLEKDVNTALGGTIDKRIPKTEAQKAYENATARVREKQNDFDSYLQKTYGDNYTMSDLSEEDIEKEKSLNREGVTLRFDSNLAKQARTDEAWKAENADPLRHVYSSASTAKVISDKIKNIPYVGGIADVIGADTVGGFLGANLLGVGHETSAFNQSGRPFFTKVMESGKDMYNNLIGSYIGATSNNDEEIASRTRAAVKSGVTSSGEYGRDPAVQYQLGGLKYENGAANMPAVDVIEKRDTTNTVIQNAQKAADEKEDFDRWSKTYFPEEGTEPSSFAGKMLSYVPNSIKKGLATAQPYIEAGIEASGPNQVAKIINNLAGGDYDGSFKFHGGMPICYGNTCVQSTSEILQRSGQWQGKLEQDNNAFAKNYASHGYEIVQEENAQPGDIVQFYKGNYNTRDYSHMGIHGEEGKYFNDGYFDKPWHEKNEPTTAELMKNSKNPENDKAIGKVYYRYKKE